MAEIDQPDRLNRAGRRMKRRRTPAYEQALLDTEAELNICVPLASDGLRLARRIGGFSALVYDKVTDPFLRFTVAQKNYHDAITTAEEIEEPSDVMKLGKKRDMFGIDIRGISLADIEKLPLPLDDTSIRTISKFIRHGFLSRLSIKQNAAQQSALLLPTQFLARSNFTERTFNRRNPESLRPLAERMTEYMDFFIPFLTDPDVGSGERFRAIASFPWIGTSFVAAFGYYVPARLGISPSSTMKAFESMVIDNPTGLRKNYMEVLGEEVANAFRKDALPTEIHRYLQYDPTRDREASGRLIEAYVEKSEDSPQHYEEAIEIFNRNRTNIQKDINASKGAKTFEVALGNSRVDVVVASQYTQTLICILKFRNSNTHLTLDIKDDGTIYGLPQSLNSESPLLAEHLTNDLFTAMAAESKKRYPDRAPRLRDLPPSPEFLQASQFRLPEALLLKSDDEGEVTKPKKRRGETLRAIIAPLSADQPELPKAQPSRSKKYRVAYSKKKIRELAGKKITDEMVDRLAAALRQFEYGEKRVKALEEDGQYDSKDLGIRVGDFRMVIESRGAGRFRLIEVDDRRDAYKK